MPYALFTQMISSGYETDSELLKISAIHGQNIFSQWIKPSKPWVDTAMSGVQGLECRHYEFFVDGERQQPVLPLQQVLENFRKFIFESTRSSVIIVAHSAAYHFKLLIQAIEKTNMTEWFDGVIHSFTDTLPIVKKKYANRPKIKTFSLAGLARDLMKYPYSGLVHRASHTLPVLRKLAMDFIDRDSLVQESVPYKKALAEHGSNQFGLNPQAGPSGQGPPVPPRSGKRLPPVVSRRENETQYTELDFPEQDPTPFEKKDKPPYSELDHTWYLRPR